MDTIPTYEVQFLADVEGRTGGNEVGMAKWRGSEWQERPAVSEAPREPTEPANAARVDTAFQAGARNAIAWLNNHSKFTIAVDTYTSEQGGYLTDAGREDAELFAAWKAAQEVNR